MRIGFTGTRRGMTEPQLAAFTRFVSELPSLTEFHHGDCVGADDEAATVVYGVEDEFPCKVVCHPPVDEAHRAFNDGYHEIREPRTHFARNRDIVNESDLLVATPCDMEEQPLGGTWYTVNYARKRGKLVVIIWPDGTVKREGGASGP